MSAPRQLLGSTLLVCILVTALPAAPEALLPADAEILVHVNIRQLLGTPMYKKHLAPLLEPVFAQPGARKLFQAAAFDPLTDLDSISVSFKVALDPAALNRSGTLTVRGKFDPEKIIAVIKGSGPVVKTSNPGALTIYEIAGADADILHAAFVEKSALIVAPTREGVVKAAKGGNLGDEFARIVASHTGKETAFSATRMTKELKAGFASVKGLDKLAEKLEGASVACIVTDGATGKISIHCTDDQTADALKVLTQFLLVPTLKDQASKNAAVPPAVKSLAADAKITVTTDKTTVNLGVELTADAIEKAIKAR